MAALIIRALIMAVVNSTEAVFVTLVSGSGTVPVSVRVGRTMSAMDEESAVICVDVLVDSDIEGRTAP